MTDTTELLKYAEGLTWRPISEAKAQTAYLVKTEHGDIFEAYASDVWEASDPRGGGSYIIGSEVTHFMPIPDGQAGEVIKVLAETIEAAKKHQENLAITNTPALRGGTWHILNAGQARATAILGGDDAGE